MKTFKHMAKITNIPIGDGQSPLQVATFYNRIPGSTYHFGEDSIKGTTAVFVGGIYETHNEKEIDELNEVCNVRGQHNILAENPAAIQEVVLTEEQKVAQQLIENAQAQAGAVEGQAAKPAQINPQLALKAAILQNRSGMAQSNSK